MKSKHLCYNLLKGCDILNKSFSFYKFLARKFYKSRFQLEVNFNNFDPNREDAYILVGNHPCLHDGVYTSLFLKKPPKPIINAFMFTNKFTKFVLTKVYPSIAKRKGQSDIITVKSMMKTLNNGMGVMLFPEGNSSFYGKESDIPFSTVKFIKKMKKDVVIVKTDGAYLSAARWGRKSTKKGLVSMNFHVLYKGEDLKNTPLEQIYAEIKNAIKFNDFDWNRKRKHEYNPVNRALGLERFMYICPKCNSHQTISTEGNKIFCSKCGEIAIFNKYTLLEGLKFDNLVEWGELQEKEIPRLSKEKLYSKGYLFLEDTVKYKSKKIGFGDVSIINDTLYVQHRTKKYSFVLKEIKGLTLTKKDEVSFDYEEKTYMIKMQDPMLFYKIIKFKVGG